MKNTEENIQIAVCNYLRAQYPKVIFYCDLGSGMKLTIGQAVKAQRMRSSRGIPDLFIAEPVGRKNGMFIELKKEGIKLCKKNGEYVSDHIKEQSELLERLSEKGYIAEFGIGFTDTKRIIDKYMRGEFNDV